MAERKKTTLDSDVTKPQVTQPGDAPADTTDPDERASSVTPNPGDEALMAGVVNAVKPLPRRATTRDTSNDRTETYTATRPDGSQVTVSRNMETGETKVK
jgi:hypothetical protein